MHFTKETSPLISVIVPAYNVEQYLDKCLESIVEQTYTNLEIILVNDGSTDETKRLCEAWKDKDERIQVVHQCNQGLSAARNTGIDISKGKYLCFIDSDDMVDSRFIEHLVEALRITGVLLSATSYTEILEGKYPATPQETKDRTLQIREMRFEEAMTSALNGGCVGFYAWGKLFDASLKSVLRFPEGKKFEDQAIMYKVFEQAGKIAYEDANDYYYLIRSGSLSHSQHGVNIEDSYYAFSAMENHFSPDECSFYTQITARKLAACADTYCSYMLQGDKSGRQKYLMLLKAGSKEARANKHLRPALKLVYALASTSPILLDRLLKLYVNLSSRT